MPYDLREKKYWNFRRDTLWHNPPSSNERTAYLRTRHNRIQLIHMFGEDGKPGVNADFVSATEAESTIACRDFELLGTNAVRTCSAINVEGGVTLTTAGADDDQVIVLPHLDTGLSSWTGITWGTDRSVQWEALIATAASITATHVWAGLKKTNTSVMATDDDQVYFRYDDEATAGTVWNCIDSIGGVDVETATEEVVAVSTVYHLGINIDQHRIAKFYLDGTLVHTTTALTSLDLIPYIGVQATTGSAKSIVCYGTAISRLIGA